MSGRRVHACTPEEGVLGQGKGLCVRADRDSSRVTKLSRATYYSVIVFNVTSVFAKVNGTGLALVLAKGSAARLLWRKKFARITSLLNHGTLGRRFKIASSTQIARTLNYCEDVDEKGWILLRFFNPVNCERVQDKKSSAEGCP